MTAAAACPPQASEDPDMIAELMDLIYHRVPRQICYALARAEIRSLDQVRSRTREQLLAIERIGTTGADYIERALEVIDAAEAEAAIAQDVYGCPAGRRCLRATPEQRAAFDRMIAARLRGWRRAREGRRG